MNAEESVRFPHRTVGICRLLAADPDDAVSKAMLLHSGRWPSTIRVRSVKSSAETKMCSPPEESGRWGINWPRI